MVSREDLGQRNPHGVRGDLKRPHLEMGLCIPLLPSIPYPPFCICRLQASEIVFSVWTFIPFIVTLVAESGHPVPVEGGGVGERERE